MRKVSERMSTRSRLMRSACMSAVAALVLGFSACARAETMSEALASAYASNPQLNAQRAETRATDENLPAARGSFLPTVTAQGNYGVLQQDILNTTQKSRTFTFPKGGALVVNWTIFNGFRGVNGVNQAEAQIHQSREALRNIELTVLSASATAYMNVLRDIAIVDLRENYVRIMDNQVKMTEERLKGGDATLTDLYQAQTAVAQARQDLSSSYVNLKTSLSIYRQQIGKTAKNLAPVAPLDELLPHDLKGALERADKVNPLINAAKYNLDVNELGVKLAEGELLPTVSMNGQVGQQYSYAGAGQQRFFQGGANVLVSVPLYEGGINYAGIRQAKEKATQARFICDQQTDQVHQAVEAAWATWKESAKYLAAAKEQTRQAEAALAGIREELKYGQRTTWEILNAQLTLVNARIYYVVGQTQRVVSTFGLLAAIGDLSANTLGLNVPKYRALDHYEAVRYQWIGTEPWK
jgi:outer membrane protein